MSMVRLIPAAVITGSAMLGAAVGNFIEDHTISLHAMAAVGGIVLPATWWLSRRLVKLDSRLDLNDERVQAVERRVADSLARIEVAISHLPCEVARCETEANERKKHPYPPDRPRGH